MEKVFCPSVRGFFDRIDVWGYMFILFMMAAIWIMAPSSYIPLIVAGVIGIAKLLNGVADVRKYNEITLSESKIVIRYGRKHHKTIVIPCASIKRVEEFSPFWFLHRNASLIFTIGHTKQSYHLWRSYFSDKDFKAIKRELKHRLLSCELNFHSSE